VRQVLEDPRQLSCKIYFNGVEKNHVDLIITADERGDGDHDDDDNNEDYDAFETLSLL
jgi:hypothetical protein